MHVTTIEGVVHNGQILLQDQAVLPENTKVYVVVPDLPRNSPVRIASPHFANPRQAGDFKKIVVEIVPNAEL